MKTSQNQLEALSKRDLAKMVKDLVKEATPTPSNTAIDSQISALCKEFADFRGEMQAMLGPLMAEHAQMKADVKNAQNEIELLKQLVASQQKLIGQHEKERRAKNLVITGVPSTEPLKAGDTTAATDKDKVDLILSNAIGGFDKAAVQGLFRLGQGANRPLLVKMADPALVGQAMEGKKGLKAIPGLDKVYIRRDMSVAEQQERSRLLREFRAAKGDPSNTGKSVELKRGQLIINGQVVDSVQIHKPFLA